MTKLTTLLLGLFFFVSCASNNQEKQNLQKRAEILYTQGTSYLIEKDYTSALDFLMRAHQVDPEDSRILNNLGMAYYFKNRPTQAESHIRRAIELDPKNSDARNNLASLLFSQNRLDEARQEYEKVLSDLVYRNQYRVKYNLALIHIRQDNKARAIQLLKEASEEHQDYCAANYQLGLLYRQARQFQTAIEWFSKASDGTCYGEPAPHLQLAELYELINKPEMARLKYEDLLERFPDRYGTIARTRLRNIESKEEMARSVRSSNQSAPSFESPKF